MQAAGAIPAVFSSMFPKHGAWRARCILRASIPFPAFVRFWPEADLQGLVAAIGQKRTCHLAPN